MTNACSSMPAALPASPSELSRWLKKMRRDEQEPYIPFNEDLCKGGKPDVIAHNHGNLSPRCCEMSSELPGAIVSDSLTDGPPGGVQSKRWILSW